MHDGIIHHLPQGEFPLVEFHPVKDLNYFGFFITFGSGKILPLCKVKFYM
jgi:hypothetical protein